MFRSACRLFQFAYEGDFQSLCTVPFPFRFPFQLHWELVSSGICSQSVQNILIGRVTSNKRPILVLSLLRFSKMTSELITFNYLRCHSGSTALETRTGYWKSTQRGTDETPLSVGQLYQSSMVYLEEGFLMQKCFLLISFIEQWRFVNCQECLKAYITWQTFELLSPFWLKLNCNVQVTMCNVQSYVIKSPP